MPGNLSDRYRLIVAKLIVVALFAMVGLVIVDAHESPHIVQAADCAGDAVILGLEPADSKYDPGDLVRVEFHTVRTHVAATGNVTLVLEIQTLGGQTVYDSNPGANQTIDLSGSGNWRNYFDWFTPENAQAGDYKILASIRSSDNWDDVCHATWIGSWDSAANEGFFHINEPPSSNLEMVLHRVSDTTGFKHTSNPGSSRSSFAVGATVRITMAARNNGLATVGVNWVLNLALANNHSDVRFNSDPIANNKNDKSVPADGDWHYYSFEWKIPSDAPILSYDLLGALRNPIDWDDVLDDTQNGANTKSFNPFAWKSTFSITPLQHLLTTRDDPGGCAVCVSGSGWYGDGATAFIGPAPAKNGYTFSFWRRDGDQNIGNDPNGVAVTVGSSTLVEAVYSTSSMELVLHRVSDTSGLRNSINPGSSQSSFEVNQTVRVTMAARNNGRSNLEVNWVLNLALANNHRDMRFNSDPTANNANDKNISSNGDWQYYSFDWKIPPDAPIGSYDLLGAVRASGDWDDVLDDTQNGVNTKSFSSDAWKPAFSITPKRYLVTIRIDPGGCGTCISGSGLYDHNSIAKIGPAPLMSDYTFLFWRRDGSQDIGANQSGVSVTVNASILVEAVYSRTPPPILRVSTDTLEFTSVSSFKRFSITNDGGGTLTWKIMGTQDWLNVTSDNGSTTSSSSIAVRVDATSSTRFGELFIDSDGGSASISIHQLYIPPPPSPDQPILDVDLGFRATDIIAPLVRDAAYINWDGRDADMQSAQVTVGVFSQADARCKVLAASGETTGEPLSSICDTLSSRFEDAKEVLLEWDIRLDHPATKVLRRFWYHNTQPEQLVITVTIFGITLSSSGATLPILTQAVAIRTAPGIATEAIREAQIEGLITKETADESLALVGAMQIAFSLKGAAGSTTLHQFTSALRDAGFTVLETLQEFGERYRVSVETPEGMPSSFSFVANSTPAVPSRVATETEPIQYSIVRIWEYENSTGLWNLYDPRPAFTSVNTIQKLEIGTIYWLNVDKNESVTLNGKKRDLFEGWNLIVW